MGRTSEAKQHLIETALQLIWEDSYHSVGVNEICKKAGVKPGSFYYFFPSKRDLALAAMDFHWSQAKELILEPSFHSEIPPLERIKKMFDRVYAFHSERQKEGKLVLGCAFGSFVGELGEEDEVIRRRLQTIFSSIASYFEKALADAVSTGILNVKKNKIPAMAQALVAYYEGLAILARAQNSAEIIRELSPYALNLINLK